MTLPIPAIEILHGRQGAARAHGIAVVIDVLRAFSTACYIMAAGARRLLAVAEAETAKSMKRSDPAAILVGERRGYRLDGFDMGNSPSSVPELDWHDRTVILTTSNGTMGLAAACNAEQVITGSFVNAGAIIRHIQRRPVPAVSLVCMGSAGRPALEDTLCAQYIRDALMDRTPVFQEMKDRIMKSPEAARFLDGHSRDLPSRDLALCLNLDRFDFVLQAGKGRKGGIELQRVPSP